MSNLLKELENKINDLESHFQKNLDDMGNKELACDFSDIITLRKSLEVLSRKANTNSFLHIRESEVKQAVSSQVSEAKTNRNTTTATNNFVLSKAVKDIAKGFNTNETFSIDDVWNKLTAKYPNEIKDDSRKRSASATLSNLTKADELIRVQKGIGGEQTIYKIKDGLFD